MSIKKLISPVMALVLLMGSGCKTPAPEQEIEYTPQPYTATYKNHIEIDGQWGASQNTGANGQYGVGDPFIMRYNGKYYMYPSTSDPCDGIKVFQSDDLVNWEYKGFAVAESEATAHGAYAPEVVYYNGYFYMCQSRAGKGHYIYRSKSPTEGFTLYSKSDSESITGINYGNLGMGIDGAFYVSDDGKLYIMHTVTPAGLRYNEITDVNDIRPQTIGSAEVLGEANLNHWIEGPGVFRRGDYSYLTYAGNHVISRGYRIGYSFARNMQSLSDFIQPTDNITIIDTHPEHYGLGHSSNANGPDLDSVYTAYHNYVGGGPQRRYNLDRYFASAGLLTANGVTHREVAVPRRPDAEASDGSKLQKSGNKLVIGTSEGYFTAEFNLIPTEGQRMYFGDRYFVELTQTGIALYENGSVIGEKQVYYAPDALSTVRVENGDGVGHIYLNGMRVISYSAKSAPGEIGYATAEGVSYTAFTNDVFGTSDFEALKNFPTKFPATTYLKGENRGFSIKGAAQVKGGVRVGEKQSIAHYEEEDVYAVKLAQGDWVKYGVDVGTSDTYSIAARVGAGSAGARLKITVGESVLECTVPDTSTYGETVKVSLGRMTLQKGLTSMKVEVLSGNMEVVSFEVYENAGDPEVVQISDFKKERGNAVVSEQEASVVGGEFDSQNGVLLWGNAGISDFEATLTFTCEIDAQSDLGIMIRAEDFSYHGDQPRQSWRGYYLKMGNNLMVLNRYDYGSSMLAAARFNESWNSGAGTHVLKMRVQSNKFTFWLDGELMFTATDDCAFLSGQLGLYSASGSLTVTKLEYKTL